jgi:hypothetical protein
MAWQVVFHNSKFEPIYNGSTYWDHTFYIRANSKTPLGKQLEAVYPDLRDVYVEVAAEYFNRYGVQRPYFNPGNPEGDPVGYHETVDGEAILRDWFAAGAPLRWGFAK